MNLRGRNKVSPEFSMSSMTDIVFLLLVFFLLTSPAITPDALDLILPKAKGKSTNQQKASVSITPCGSNVWLISKKAAFDLILSMFRLRTVVV